jgi:hypothetical protein
MSNDIASQAPEQRRLARTAAIMGITVEELLHRLATWTPEQWAAADDEMGA